MILLRYPQFSKIGKLLAAEVILIVQCCVQLGLWKQLVLACISCHGAHNEGSTLLSDSSVSNQALYDRASLFMLSTHTHTRTHTQLEPGGGAVVCGAI